MADMTPTQAMANAPTSTEKTALLVDMDAMVSELGTAASGGAFSDNVKEQLESEFVDWCERVASNMTDHTD